jgi:hypothetical protein
MRLSFGICIDIAKSLSVGFRWTWALSAQPKKAIALSGIVVYCTFGIVSPLYMLAIQIKLFIKLRRKTPSLQGGDIRRFCLALLQSCMFITFQLAYSNSSDTFEVVALQGNHPCFVL